MTDKAEYGKMADLTMQVSEPIAEICVALRGLIMTIEPNAQEIVWVKQKIASYGIGPKKMTEHYLYIAPFKNHVNFGFYHGAKLDDPNNLLEGGGKDMRHIKVKSVSEIASSTVLDLVKASIHERKQSQNQ